MENSSFHWEHDVTGGGFPSEGHLQVILSNVCDVDDVRYVYAFVNQNDGYNAICSDKKLSPAEIREAWLLWKNDDEDIKDTEDWAFICYSFAINEDGECEQIESGEIPGK